MFMRPLCLARRPSRMQGCRCGVSMRAFPAQPKRKASMALTMHAASAPVFQHMLRNLTHLLDKAEASAAARKFEPSVLTTARLAPDMLPLTRQVQIACDGAKNGL